MKTFSWKTLPATLLIAAPWSQAMADGAASDLKVGASIRADLHFEHSSDKGKTANGKVVTDNKEKSRKHFGLDFAELAVSGKVTEKASYAFKLGLDKKIGAGASLFASRALLNYKISDMHCIEMGYDGPLAGGLENDADTSKVYHYTLANSTLPGKNAMARYKFHLDQSYAGLELVNHSNPMSGGHNDTNNQQFPTVGVFWFGSHDLGGIGLASNLSYHMTNYQEQKGSPTGVADHKSLKEDFFSFAVRPTFLDNTAEVELGYLMNRSKSKATSAAKEVEDSVSSFYLGLGYTAMDMVKVFTKHEMSQVKMNKEKYKSRMANTFGAEFYPEGQKAFNIHLVYKAMQDKFEQAGTFKDAAGLDIARAKDDKAGSGELLLGFGATI
jgi:hypothetical protein